MLTGYIRNNKKIGSAIIAECAEELILPRNQQINTNMPATVPENKKQHKNTVMLSDVVDNTTQLYLMPFNLKAFLPLVFFVLGIMLALTVASLFLLSRYPAPDKASKTTQTSSILLKEQSGHKKDSSSNINPQELKEIKTLDAATETGENKAAGIK